MRKKFFAVALVFALALSCLSLVACGGSKGGGTPGPNASSVKGEQVTAEQWAAAFDISTVTNVSVKQSLEEKQGNVTGGYTAVYRYDGNKVYEYGEEYLGKEKDWQELYYELDGETEYMYDVVDGKWARSAEWHIDNEWQAQEMLNDVLRGYDSLNIAQEFALYTYDASQKAYMRVMPGDGGSPATVVIKIADGKLRVAQVTYTDKDDNDKDVAVTETFQLYDYGTTSVKLPTVGSAGKNEGSTGSNGSGSSSKPVAPGDKVEISNKMSEDMWRNALSEYAFYNCTLCLRDDTGSIVNIVQFDNGIFSFESRTMQRHWVYTRECTYENLGNGWAILQENQYEKQWQAIMESCTMFFDSYSAFTYNAQENIYFAASVTVGDKTYENVTQRFDAQYRCIESVIGLNGKASTMTFDMYGETTVQIPEVEA